MKDEIESNKIGTYVDFGWTIQVNKGGVAEQTGQIGIKILINEKGLKAIEDMLNS